MERLSFAIPNLPGTFINSDYPILCQFALLFYIFVVGAG